VAPIETSLPREQMGGIFMKYQKPDMEILKLEKKDVVTLSGEGEGSGEDVNHDSWQ